MSDDSVAPGNLPERPGETSGPPEIEGDPGGSILPPDIRSKLPPELVQQIEVAMVSMGPGQHPIARHITAGHIDKMIDGNERERDRLDGQFKERIRDRKHARLSNSIFALIAVITLAIIWAIMPANKLESFKEIAKDCMILLAGGAGGYGIAMKRLGENEE